MDASSTVLADAAALLDLPDRLVHMEQWLSAMLDMRWQMRDDPIAEIMQAEAVLSGICAELTALGSDRVRSDFRPARGDPMGFLHDARAFIGTVKVTSGLPDDPKALMLGTIAWLAEAAPFYRDPMATLMPAYWNTLGTFEWLRSQGFVIPEISPPTAEAPLAFIEEASATLQKFSKLLEIDWRGAGRGK